MTVYDDSPGEGGSMKDAMVPVSKNVIVNSKEMNNQTRSEISSGTVSSVEDVVEDRNCTSNLPMNVVGYTNDGLVVPSRVNNTRFYNNISVTKSPNSHLGDQTLFHGPVQIENFVCSTPNLGDIVAQDSNAVQSDVSENEFAAAESSEGGCCLNRTRWNVALMTSLACLVMANIVTVVVMLSRDQNDDTPKCPDKYPKYEYNYSFEEIPGFIGRTEWQARLTDWEMDKLPHPVTYVIIHDSRVSNVSRDCSTVSECSSRVRDIQRNHMEKRCWSDIAFNFLVGGDGNIFIGRGWNFSGSHTYKYNIKSIGICFIGDFNSNAPPKQQLEAAKRIIEYGLEHKLIADKYKLVSHRVFRQYRSPGDALNNIINSQNPDDPKGCFEAAPST